LAKATKETQAEKDTIDVSVVIPVYNEEASLDILFGRLLPVLEGLGKTYEVILTNDGSKDRSSELLEAWHRKHPQHIKVVEFNRNYGQHMAIMAGFEQAQGAVIVTMDADLQNYPEDIPLVLEKIDQGHDVVGGVRQNRQDKAWRIYFSRLHNILREKLTKIKMEDEGCMLRAYRRDVVQHMVASQEHSTFIPALAVSFAENPTDIPVRHAAREAGESNYNFYKLVRYNFDLFANFSRAPLEAFTFTGCVVALMSVLLFIYLMVQRIIQGPDVEGVFTLFAILYFLVGIVLMGLGIIGEYIGRIYEEVRKRPRYIVKRVLGSKK
jgi:undecaprenyl-phosphate 4-deoxy-4-formamido-L-arabinose transferase